MWAQWKLSLKYFHANSQMDITINVSRLKNVICTEDNCMLT